MDADPVAIEEVAQLPHKSDTNEISEAQSTTAQRKKARSTILEETAIAKEKAYQAAYDEKTKQSLRRRQARKAGKAKQEAAYAAVYKARAEALPGFKIQPRVPHQASLTQDNPTSRLEEKLKSVLFHQKPKIITEAQQAANVKALRMMEEDEQVGNEEERQFQPTFTNERTGLTKEFKPAQPGRQDWDSAHDDRCLPLLGCCEWQGKQSDCARKDIPSSSNSSLSNQYSHHRLNVIQLVSSKKISPKMDHHTFDTQRGTRSMATVIPRDKCMKNSSSSIVHSLGGSESQSFLSSYKESTLHQISEFNCHPLQTDPDWIINHIFVDNLF